jgi:deoxycytidylate deaminase
MEGDCPRGMAPYAVIPADSPYSDCISVHAEIVALSKAYGTEEQSAWFKKPDIIMVVTHRPCHECTEVLEALDFPVYYLEEL